MSDERIRVLFLAADPFRETARPELEKAVHAVDHAIRQRRARITMELVPHLATCPRGVREALLRHRPQVVHFAGAGGGPGGIRLEDGHGGRGAADREVLGTLFGAPAGVRVAVVTGGGSLPAVEALGGVVDYAVGMDRAAADALAVTFAEAFYVGLACGRGVRTAFELAVIQLQMDYPAEPAAPVLRVRAGVDPQAALVAPPASAGWSAAPAARGRRGPARRG
ncbi:MAG TPA: hypothetical protein VHG08_00475 [Longimicrobium sp.]|nr:hypothetical protein [Longimicrobium sp.]